MSSHFVLDIRARLCGAQIVACEAARRLAVETHDAEHALEDEAVKARGR